jgi:hypothetical protein
MDWTDAEEDDTYDDSRITVDGCAEVGYGTFYLEAENIPSGSNPIPFITSNSGCIHYISTSNDDDDYGDEDIFDEITHLIPGTCSGVGTETDGSTVSVVINMKHLCPGSIAAIIICSIIGGLLLLAVLVFALGGGGGGGSSDDYAAL